MSGQLLRIATRRTRRLPQRSRRHLPTGTAHQLNGMKHETKANGSGVKLGQAIHDLFNSRDFSSLEPSISDEFTWTIAHSEPARRASPASALVPVPGDAPHVFAGQWLGCSDAELEAGHPR